MLHMDAMFDSLSKTVRRNTSLISHFNTSAKLPSSSGDSSTLSRGSSLLSNPAQPQKTFLARVHFLDDTCHTFEVQKRAKGQTLMEAVFDHLDEAIEQEYFGLMFHDDSAGSSSSASGMPKGHAPDVMRWLDMTKLVRKQLRCSNHHSMASGKAPHVTVYFRVKFYMTDPSRLKEEFTRYQVYLQVKKDLTEGRLHAPMSTICLLTSYAVQSTVGDYDADTCTKGYLSPFHDLKKYASDSTETLPEEEVDRRVVELHKLHKGQPPAEAELNFLEHAKRLEMYGIALHPGKDSHGRSIQLGVTCIGLVVFQNSVKINTFSWSKIVKISFKRKQFFIQLRKELTESYDTLLGFNLASYRSCKNLWKSAVEHHSFFRLHSPKPPTTQSPPRRFLMLNLGSKFRYSGRTEFQATSTPDSTLLRPAVDKKMPAAKNFSRCHLRKTLPLNLEPLAPPATGRVPKLASPETSSIGSSVHSNGGLKPKPSAPPPTLVPIRGQEEAANTSQSLAHRAIESFNNKVQSLSTKLPKKAWQEDGNSDDDGGFLDSQRANISSLSRIAKRNATSTVHAAAAANPVPASVVVPPPSICLADNSPESSSGSGSGFPGSGSIHSGSGNSNGTSAKLTPVSLKLPITPAGSRLGATTTTNGNSDGGEEGNLVIISITPDEQGRFGFNVKGGVDQKMPIIVSRVGANTPADKCYPRLNEGDQVVLINGRDVSTHSHDQVVNFIRASSEPHSAQLVLAVRQNVYMGEDVEEPEFQYVPEAPHVSPLIPGTQALSQSMLLLEESLESGAIIGQFEQLYRRNTSLAMAICHLPDNLNKNRYRDISPYDSTRFVLTECTTGDYINANHVVMNIPGSGIINRYIATQGPLGSTCIDFWYMTWEGQSTLIIMLTTIVERGRIKCHKYWPDVGICETFGCLEVTCITEDIRDSLVFREFTIRHSETQEVRQVTQMAYLSWPDHGVPDNSVEFVAFVEAVRSHRQGSLYPTVVHCSAGIGRTGVLILMETALYLIEANQPVYPLDLTRAMRDQRASMIQTPSQYKFVCEAILKVYNEGKVKPLPEFCQTT